MNIWTISKYDICGVYSRSSRIWWSYLFTWKMFRSICVIIQVEIVCLELVNILTIYLCINKISGILFAQLEHIWAFKICNFSLLVYYMIWNINAIMFVSSNLIKRTRKKCVKNTWACMKEAFDYFSSLLFNYYYGNIVLFIHFVQLTRSCNLVIKLIEIYHWKNGAFK